jgi:hypothetical protein
MSNIMRGGKIDSILNGVALGSLPVYAIQIPFYDSLGTWENRRIRDTVQHNAWC